MANPYRSIETLKQPKECSFYFTCVKCNSIRICTIDNEDWGQLDFDCPCGIRVKTGVLVKKYDGSIPRGFSNDGPVVIERLVKSGRPRKVS